jgi:hypothetical protein
MESSAFWRLAARIINISKEVFKDREKEAIYTFF